ncbi:putative N-acetylated-alpha-linked acidic dipeptidase [Ornithodoros turicata]|uniref:putative N-acetylated-alpha-linked acidic dipeptidase n=1 Tax=Ornithodoros turicata TaxID=34597 RepID=UPI003139FB1F
MTEYIRGKKAYTKWDADTDNVDMDLSPDGPQVMVQSYPTGWFAGTKGKVLRVLIPSCIFLLGLIIGYLMRKGVREVIEQNLSGCTMRHDVFTFKEDFAEMLVHNVDKANLDNWLKIMTTNNHVAGTEKSEKLAIRIEQTWRNYGIENARIESFHPLLSYPDTNHSNEVRIVKGSSILFNTSATGLETTSEMGPYSAYSASGKVKGKPVYANYGTPADFDLLRSRNIALKNTIAIIRYGKIHPGDKVRLAQENGVAAVVLYSDPFASSAEEMSELKLPGDAITRGSLKPYPGDPSTPFLPSSVGMYAPPSADRGSMALPTIPVQPVSYNDAQELLNNMSGSMAPVEWQGKLNITYNVGPGYKTSHDIDAEVTVYNTLKHTDIHNVIGVIRGNFQPGRYVIVGCHHDAWTKGAGSPGTGMAVLMELVRLFGDLQKNGWQPGRTLIFASWDATEFGTIGSTEWVQAHQSELTHKAVAYINLDQAVSGNNTLYVLGSPLLRQSLKEATKLIPCHESSHNDMTVYDMWKMRKPRSPNDAHSVPLMMPLTAGSDFVPFYENLGISSAHLQFVEKDPVSDYPLHHTAYDTYEAVVNFTDPNLYALSTLTKVVGVLLLKLTDSLQVPMRAIDYADQIKFDYAEFEKKYSQLLKDHSIGLESLSEAVVNFSKIADNFHDNYEEMNKHNILEALQDYNDRLLELERAFLLPPAYPSHRWLRHVIYGPESGSGHTGVLFPHLSSSIDEAKLENHSLSWTVVKQDLSHVLHALRSAANVLSAAVLRGRE